MKIGYHDAKVVSATAGSNDNGKRLVDFVLENEAGERANIQMYFSTPENTRISMQQLRALGWSRGNPRGLDAVLGAVARIEVYEDTWLDREGNERTSVKARFSAVKNAVATPMSQKAAADWLDSMDPASDAGATRHPREGW